MSEPIRDSEIEQPVAEEEGEYVTINDVDEIVPEDENDAEPIEDDDENESHDLSVNQEGNIELDLSNNSRTFFDTHKDSIFTVFTHPTLPLVVTGGGDDTAYLWTTHTQVPKVVTELEGHKESVISGGFAGNGSYLITGDMAGKVQIFKSTKRGQKWDLLTSLEEVEEVVWIRAHPTQDLFAFGARDGSVWSYAITDQGVDILMTGFSHSLECTTGEFYDLQNQDSASLLTTSEDGTIVGWNCFTGQQNFKIEAEQLKGIITAWVTISIDPVSNIAAVGSRNGQIAIINSGNGSVLNILQAIEIGENDDEFDASIEALAWNRSQSILAAGLVSGDVILFDINSWKPRRSLKLSDAVTKLIFVENTPFLFGSSMNGKVYKWDARTGAELHVCVGHYMGVLDFALQTKDPLTVITAGDDGVSLVFDIPS
ncbi:hypothetical protein LJB42_000844 [Komagataella kurtzmanii]|nr:hypothetical protein LJB42_000844 [Komagataella kurtzmanii]